MATFLEGPQLNGSSELAPNTIDEFIMTPVEQPKREVADYVESCGILTPRRFNTIEEAQNALNKGIPIIARTEHMSEYGGASGIGTSKFFTPEPRAVVRDALARHAADDDRGVLRRLVREAGMDPNEYIPGASLSYWEFIRGTNISIVADDAIEGRYHIFMVKENDDLEGTTCGYSGLTVENGDVAAQAHFGMAFSTEDIPRIIEMYEQVRNLEKFNSNNCPIMEMQIDSSDGFLYFLQYHLGRDKNNIAIELRPEDYRRDEGWYELEAVRGAYIGSEILWLFNRSDSFMGRSGKNGLAHEQLVRDRKVDINTQGFYETFKNIATRHGERSRWIKPEMSGVIGRGVVESLGITASGDCVGLGIDAKIASDGRIGYVLLGDLVEL